MRMLESVTVNLLVKLFSAFIFLLSSSFAIANSSNQLTPVNLQLKWQHQFQFAGYYAAIEQGYYREAGLDVNLIEAKPGQDSIQRVFAGEAEFGVGTSELMLNYNRGDPVMVLGVIMQHSPLALAVLNTADISNIHQLARYPMMIEPNSLELFAYFKNEGVDTNQLKLIKHTHQTHDLIKDKVKSMSIYITDETYEFFSNEIEYQLFRPLMGGIDFYGDNLFTTKTLFDENPELVKNFRKASLKGWQYAMQYPDEIIQLILSKYSKRKKAEHLRYEANKMRELMEPSLIEVGYSNPGRWKHIAQTYLSLGIISDVKDVDGMLYQPSVESSYQKLKTQLFYASIAIPLLILLWIIYYWQNYLANMRGKQFETLYSNAPVSLVELDTNGIIKNWNSEAEKTFQYAKEEAIGKNIYDLIVPNDITDSINTIVSSTWKTNQITHSENLNIRKDGQEILCNWSNVPFEAEYKKQKTIICMVREVTKEKELEQKLKLAASVFTHAGESIVITDAAGMIVDINHTFSSTTGYSREEAIGQNPRILQSGRQSVEFYADMWSALLKEHFWSGEIWNRRKCGEVYAEIKTISAVRDERGVTTHYVALGSDITLMKEHQGQLERVAHYDILTNLPNRSLLSDRLSQAMLQCTRHEQSLAVVFLDLDGFKAVNDTYGHDIGDELLIRLSLRMKEALRENDNLARIGGDEFVAVLADLTSVEGCEPILERLLQAASEPVIIDDIVLNVSASVGVTFYPQDNVDADLLMRHADQAMYIAKESGRNRYHLFDTVQDVAVKVQQESLEAIRSAIDNHEFVLYYQPKVNMRSGSVVGVEALIRWQHPKRGLLNPIDFLPIIENNPMSIELGEWVIDTALSQINQWQIMGLDIPLNISVNIAALQLQQPDFTERLMALLAAHPNVNPRYLELEILETSALGDVNHASTIMKACMALGVSFALDDFGTGYSSLTYLRRLPTNLIKIDQSFVRDMLHDDDDLAIVGGVVALAKSFKRDVIAEGVETIEHGTALLQLGCELAQGYGIARPMPSSDFPYWINNWEPDVRWKT